MSFSRVSDEPNNAKKRDFPLLKNYIQIFFTAIKKR